MTKDDIVQQVTAKYQAEGYRVTKAAATGVLPLEMDHLREHVGLIAQKDHEYVVVEIKRRDQLYEIPPPLQLAVKQQLPGFRYDLVVYPPDGVDGIPLEDGEPRQEYVDSLLTEAGQLLDCGKPRAAFLLAWSAVESTMRTAARRESLEIGNGDPLFVLKTLYSNGVISYDEYDLLQRQLDGRNRLVHGLSIDPPEADDIRHMIGFARQLLCEAPAPSDV
jgi:hypothetical protein